MASPLLLTKLHQPPLRDARVSRERLHERLEAHVGSSSSVTLVVAPAGFGKTSLVSGWLEHSAVTRCWLSLDESDNDVWRFWRYLLAAIARVQPTAAASAQDLLTQPQKPPLETLLTVLINDLSQAAEFSQIDALSSRNPTVATNHLVLVIDDYHLIDDANIHASISFFVEHLPAGVHVLLISRSEPPLPLARLRARAQLLEITQADLRFDHDEACQFLQEVMGLQLTSEDIAQLEHKTEGWVAGLQMAALALQGQQDLSQRIHQFSANERYILDYLVAEVLNQQPANVQQFLLESAALKRMSAPLCDELLQRDDSRSLLDTIERANLFVIPLDSQRHWYRYHHLFADLLRRQLDERHPGRVQQLQRAAGDYYWRTGNQQEAFDYYLQAGDSKQAAAVLEADAENALGRGDAASLTASINRLPARELERRPRLLVALAWHNLFQAEGNAIPPLLRRAERALAEHDTSERERAKLAAESMALQAFVGGTRNTSTETIDLAKQAMQQLEPTAFAQVALRLLVGDASFIHGNWQDAVAAYDDAIQGSYRLDSSFGEVTAQVKRVQVLRLLGQLSRAKQDINALLSRLTERDHAMPYVSMLYVYRAHIAWDRFELEQATQDAEHGLAVATRFHDTPSLLDVNTSLALIARDQGDIERAQYYFAKMSEIASKLPIHTLKIDERYDALEVWLAHQAAPAWLQRYSKYQDDLASHFEHVVYAHALLWAGRYHDAAAYAEKHAARLWQRSYINYYLQHMMVAICAHAQLGERERASEHLRDALQAGQPEGFVTCFVRAGEVLAGVLEPLVFSDAALKRHQQRILAAIAGRQLHHAPLPEGLLEPLSDREDTVLRLMVAGMSNKEIAKELDVSVNTVKTHTRNIYSKFGVHGRVALIKRAQDIGTT